MKQTRTATEWHGTDQEGKELLDILDTHCTCRKQYDQGYCFHRGAHSLLLEQKTVDLLLGTRRNAGYWISQEMTP